MAAAARSSSPVLVAAVEGGGTTFCVAVAQLEGSAVPKILYRTSIDSSHDDPQTTLRECAQFFTTHKPPGGYHALGIATFGPAGVNPSSKTTYGTILATSPKKAWRNVDLMTPLVQACRGSRHLAVRVETDVNAPALAEYEQCKKVDSNISSLAYVTVGTGVGVGLVVNHQTVHGRMHPEGGHVAVRPLPGDDFEGYSWGEKSPYRGQQTVEGIASSVALAERLTQRQGGGKAASREVLSQLPDDHDVWNHAANAIANLCVTLLLVNSMEKIVLGGGILKRKNLLEKVQAQTVVLLNGYLELPPNLSDLITTSTWGDEAGLVGAVVLPQKAHEQDIPSTRFSATPRESTTPAGFVRGVLVGLLAGVAGAAILSGRRRP